MKYIFQFFKLRSLYIYFLLFAVFNIFFSTGNSNAKTFQINDVAISTPFENNFNKNEIIDKGFIFAFDELMLSLVQSKDKAKLKKTPLKQIKGMIETFSIKEEKFINEIYYLNLNVSFNKKNIFKYLEEKNIFPSLPTKKDIIFIPIIFDQDKNEVEMYSENILFNNWDLNKKRYDLINYILPSEDIEDFNLIKNNIKNSENFDFSKIVNKYNLQDFIIAIVFKNNNQARLLNKIYLNERKTLNQLEFNKLNLDNEEDVNKFILNLKELYEDFWKSQNQINSSVKLNLTIALKNNNNIKINQFEEKLSNLDLVYDFFIYKFDNKKNFYRVIFNGTPDKFLEIMKANKYEFETKNKIWVLK